MLKTKRLLLFLTIIVPIVIVAFGFIKNKRNSTTQQSPAITDQNTPSKSQIKEFSVQEVDYSKWKTYTNDTYNYTVKYPADWNIDSSEANNTPRDPNDGSCCKASNLTINNGGSKWVLSLNVLYTGGDGYAIYDFPECKPYEKSPCAYTKVGPIDLGNIESKSIYKQEIVNGETDEILHVDFRAGVPVFMFRPESSIDDKGTAYGSIYYVGENLINDIIPLDQITNSLKFE